jgi:uncharacterized protein involved in response to NO
LWIAGRVLVLTPFALTAALANAAFPVAVAVGIGIPLVRSANRRNDFFIALLLALVLRALASSGLVAAPLAVHALTIGAIGGMFLESAYLATVPFSGLRWSAAFALYAIRHWPVLSRERFDGKPGQPAFCGELRPRPQSCVPAAVVPACAYSLPA